MLREQKKNTDWEKIIVKDILIKDCYSKYDNKFLKLNNRKMTTQFKKMDPQNIYIDKELNRHFTKEDTQIASK